MATAEQLLEWARTQLGVTESPAGSNHVRYWDDAGMPTLQGSPWCAAFYLAGLLAVGVEPVTRSVWVPAITADYKMARRLHPVADAVPGDQILYQIGKGHTGVLESIDIAHRTVTCIEGNTTSGTQGVQDNGGGVYRRTRPWSLVVGAGRPVFTQKVAPMHDPPWIFEPIVADLACPTGGAWLLSADGDVYAVGGAPFHKWPTQAVDFAGRTAAQLELGPDATHPYTIVDTAGERYSP